MLPKLFLCGGVMNKLDRMEIVFGRSIDKNMNWHPPLLRV
jgi:hypothetical protein